MVIDFINRFALNPLRQLGSSVQAPIGLSTQDPARQSLAATGKVPPASPSSSLVFDAEQTAKTVLDLNDYAQQAGREIHFSVHEDSGKTIIKVMNTETEELIRQIPPEEVLALAEFLAQAQDITTTGLSEKV